MASNETSPALLSAEYKLNNAIERIERIDFLISAAGDANANARRGKPVDAFDRQVTAALAILEDEIVNLRVFLYGETLSPPVQHG